MNDVKIICSTSKLGTVLQFTIIAIMFYVDNLYHRTKNVIELIWSAVRIQPESDVEGTNIL